MEMAGTVEKATKKVSPQITFGSRVYAGVQTNEQGDGAPGPGTYVILHRDRTGCVRYSNRVTKSRLSNDGHEGPGPGEYSIIPPLIKPSFNRGKRAPRVPTRTNTETEMMKSELTVEQNRDGCKNVPQMASRPLVPPPSGDRRSRLGSSLRSSRRQRVETTAVPVSTEKLHDQRKIAASMLRNLVAGNQKQLSTPILKILKALQEVKLFKALSIDQLRKLTYLLEEEVLNGFNLVFI